MFKQFCDPKTLVSGGARICEHAHKGKFKIKQKNFGAQFQQRFWCLLQALRFSSRYEPSDHFSFPFPSIHTCQVPTSARGPARRFNAYL